MLNIFLIIEECCSSQTNYRLKRRRKSHIVEGLVKALDVIDEIIALIEVCRMLRKQERACEHLVSPDFRHRPFWI